MTRLHLIQRQLLRYPHTNEALLAIAIWPILFATGCWQTPQIVEVLSNHGAEISMKQFFLAGFAAYLFLLSKHRFFNHRIFKCHAVDIAWYRRLCEVDRGMVAAGLAGTGTHMAVTSEMARYRRQLGFLVDADDFYRKLRVLLRVMSWLRGRLK